MLTVCELIASVKDLKDLMESNIGWTEDDDEPCKLALIS